MKIIHFWADLVLLEAHLFQPISNRNLVIAYSRAESFLKNINEI